MRAETELRKIAVGYVSGQIDFFSIYPVIIYEWTAKATSRGMYFSHSTLTIQETEAVKTFIEEYRTITKKFIETKTL